MAFWTPWLAHLKTRRRAARRHRAARRALDLAFANPALLGPTSLRPDHKNRTVILSHDFDGDQLLRVHFRILRHPRPYAFSKQFHEVLETWTYDLPSHRLLRTASANLTRARGGDGEPSSFGPGV
jgi:hypothetical protein